MTTRLPEATRRRFRNKVRAMFWRKATMPCYYSCPHEYVVRRRSLFRASAAWGCSERDFQFLKETIACYGERTKWRHRRDVVFFDGRFVYFVCGPVINRTDKRSMLNDGYPPTEVLAQMRKRFWPTKADRRKYRE